MRTQYEIRRADLCGIFIGFDSDYDAISYWRENIENAGPNDVRRGAVVVRHTWETHHEAETARLDFLISPGSIAKFSAACLAVDQELVSTDWPKAARLALDCARKSPPDTVVVIWPNTQVTDAARCMVQPLKL
jgi:hypothetical protein